MKVITIEDNGIGREAAKAFSTDSTGIGLQIMEQFYILFREYYKVRISHEIIDLYDPEGTPSGTRVVVRIPELPSVQK
jgi:two-component sensor histidine kinase